MGDRPSVVDRVHVLFQNRPSQSVGGCIALGCALIPCARRSLVRVDATHAQRCREAPQLLPKSHRLDTSPRGLCCLFQARGASGAHPLICTNMPGSKRLGLFALREGVTGDGVPIDSAVLSFCGGGPPRPLPRPPRFPVCAETQGALSASSPRTIAPLQVLSQNGGQTPLHNSRLHHKGSGGGMQVLREVLHRPHHPIKVLSSKHDHHPTEQGNPNRSPLPHS